MKVLMCPPLYYEPAAGEDASTIMAEWRGLYRLLREELDVQVDLLEPRPGMPKLVLAASGGFVQDDSFIVSRFRDVSRRPESEAWDKFFLVRGYAMPALPESCCFEGERDLVAVEGKLFAGCRSDDSLGGYKAVSEFLGRDICSLRLSDDWDWPVDTCLCPLGNGTALYHPEAFHRDAREILEEEVPGLQAMERDDGHRLGCNALVVKGRVVLPEGCDATVARLEQQGFRINTLPLASYAQHAAGPKALVLKIKD